MKRSTLLVFWIITFLVFGVAWWGKQHGPQYLSAAWIQYAAAVFTALACPLGVLFALRLMHEGDRGNGYWLLLAFCAPVVTALTTVGTSAPTVGRYYASMKPTRQDYGAMARSSEFCLASEQDPKKRNQSAAFAYTTWGIKLALLHRGNDITLFIPSSADELELARTVESWKLSDQTEKMLDEQLRQMPWFFGIYMGGFCVVFAVGLGWFAYGGRRATTASQT
jgi:hypothetical protein